MINTDNLQSQHQETIQSVEEHPLQAKLMASLTSQDET